MSRELPIGTAISRCSACKKVFSSVFAFDKHRVGKSADRRCLSTDEIVEKGMCLNGKERWISAVARAVDQQLKVGTPS